MNYEDFYTLTTDFQPYYDQLVSELADREKDGPKTYARTLDAPESMPGEARAVLDQVPAAAADGFCEFGSPMPPLLEGCTVVDLGCGTGRDAFLAALLVGSSGRVIGVDPDADKLAVAQAAAEGFANVEFVNSVPERVEALADGVADVVISNCTFNLSPDKAAYIREVNRLLKDNGEWYFTDVFSDRRIPQDLAQTPAQRADRLAGAMYVGDFRRLVQAGGFNDPRYLMYAPTPVSSTEQESYGDVVFATLTIRAMKSEWSEDVCESYGETVAYDGSLPDYPDFFLFEHAIKFPTGKECTVCGNVTTVAKYSRYAKVFTVVGDRSHHVGDTHHTFDVLFGLNAE